MVDVHADLGWFGGGGTEVAMVRYYYDRRLPCNKRIRLCCDLLWGVLGVLFILACALGYMTWSWLAVFK